MPTSPRSIAVVTSSRADYGHLYWPLHELKNTPIRTSLLVTGAHLSPEFGHTVDVIEADGFEITARIECLVSADTDVAMARTIGLATLGFADELSRLRPDAVLVVADRYEMLAPAQVATALRIPIIHVEGGEASEGAIDHVIRNALTMMSHVHMTPTALATRRVIAMGEEPWRVHQVGAPSLDHLRRSRLLDREELETALGSPLADPILVVSHHPVTLDRETTAEADAVHAALEELVKPEPSHANGPHTPTVVFCFPNADAGSRRLMARAHAFCDRRLGAQLVVNLDPVTYWSLLSHAAAIVGNSSSGIMESPSLGLPAVNVGRRQDGRERAANVVDIPAEPRAIGDALAWALAPDTRGRLTSIVNPYGDGHAAQRIAGLLRALPPAGRLLAKRAMPDPAGPAASPRLEPVGNTDP